MFQVVLDNYTQTVNTVRFGDDIFIQSLRSILRNMLNILYPADKSVVVHNPVKK